MLPRPAAVAVLLAFSVLTAGCSVRDWYDQKGTVKIELQPVGADRSDIENLRSARVAIHSVSLRQVSSASPEEYAFDPALVVDLAAEGKKGSVIPLVEDKFTLRAIESVTIRLEPLGATEPSGASIDGCYQGVPHDPPCMRVAANGAYRLTTPIAIERGGTTIFTFPLAVRYDANTTEYYVAAEMGSARDG